MTKIKFKRKKILDLSEQPASVKKDFERTTITSRREVVGPKFINFNFEEIIQKGESYIVLGKDRTGAVGYGLMSDDCASIDLVVGRKGKPYTENGERNYIHPNFRRDASRIYISQKTDIDDALGLVSGKIGTVRAKAAIALVSDEIRIAARGGVKIHTSFFKRDSRGEIAGVFKKGVELIAGNSDADLQPMVKGDNLMRCVESLSDEVNNLNGIISTFLISQSQLNLVIMSHTHPALIGSTLPSVELIPAGIKKMIEEIQTIVDLTLQKVNTVNFKLNYLNPMSKSYLCSRHHRLN